MLIVMSATLAGVATAAVVQPAPSAGRVLRFDGPSNRRIRVGQQLGANEDIRLERGDEVLILYSGRTRRFAGPGIFRLSDPPRQSQMAAAERYERHRAAIAAVQAEDPDVGRRRHEAALAAQAAAEAARLRQERASRISSLREGISGDFCLAADSNPILVRATADQEERIEVVGPSGTATVSMPSGSTTAS